MTSIFRGAMTKIVAQVAALVLVVGGLAAFVITQANADKNVTASEENTQQASTSEPLNIERVSSITPLRMDQLALPQVIEISVAGESKEILTKGGTVQDVLDNAGIELGEDDKVSPKLDQNINDNTTINVTIVEKSQVTEDVAVKFETTYKNDNTLDKGKTKTQTEGSNGTAKVTYEIVTENGEQVDKTEIDREVTKQPTNAVVLRGTKAPQPAPSTNNSSSSNSGGGAPTSGVWARLAQCESGGNPSIVSSNGLYHGLYQFSVSTWQSVGGSGLPSQASPAEQTKRAQMLQQRSGWGQWPACSRAIGVR